jgi:amino acid permease
MTLSSYLVSNAIPFFKDLVALIGALNTVPLTLTLPGVLYRWFGSLDLSGSPRSGQGPLALMLYSVIFFVVGIIGAASSIESDWLHQGRGPFSCH